MVVGATSERDAGFQEGLTPNGQKQLESGLQSLLPQANNWPSMERWWGFRPCTPDETTLLGEGPIPGLWLACRNHRNGVLLAAVTAQTITDALCGTNNDNALLEQFH